MSERHETTLKRIPRRVGAVLMWAGLLVIGAFGAVFTFANYPLFGSGLLLATLLLIAYSERRRRANREAFESARRRSRARRDFSNESPNGAYGGEGD